VMVNGSIGDGNEVGVGRYKCVDKRRLSTASRLNWERCQGVSVHE
jgi:hypothetical protein